MTLTANLPKNRQCHPQKKRNRKLQKKSATSLITLTSDDLHLLSTNDLLKKFEEYVVEAATELAEKEIKKRPNWFSESEDLLIKLIGIRNNAFKTCLKCSSEDKTKKLRDARHHLLREKRRAKRKWQYQYAKKTGVEAKNDANNATILNEHFYSLFNSQLQIDATVLDELKQH